jgi:hypothetical protein
MVILCHFGLLFAEVDSWTTANLRKLAVLYDFTYLLQCHNYVKSVENDYLEKLVWAYGLWIIVRKSVKTSFLHMKYVKNSENSEKHQNTH